ncbi:MAG: hypothetical protein WBE37_13920 [Bryobacteraceae bacterium]
MGISAHFYPVILDPFEGEPPHWLSRSQRRRSAQNIPISPAIAGIDVSKAIAGKGTSPVHDGNEITILRWFSNDGSEVAAETHGQRKREGESDTIIREKAMNQDVGSVSEVGKTWTNQMSLGVRQ